MSVADIVILAVIAVPCAAGLRSMLRALQGRESCGGNGCGGCAAGSRRGQKH